MAMLVSEYPAMQGKVALVTGALTGIGRATAVLLARKVLASDRASYMTGHPLAIDGGFGAA
jgi:NAD(P)-dependent dehydrogenase (short-subunit alcohol dehydrogenase family)